MYWEVDNIPVLKLVYKVLSRYLDVEYLPRSGKPGRGDILTTK